MALEITTESGHIKATVSDEFTIFNMSEYSEALRSIDKNAETFELDLEGAAEFDTSGVQLLLSLEKQLSQESIGFKLITTNEAVLECLKLHNLLSHFNLQIDD